MKCIKPVKNGKILRVKDDKAHEMVTSGEYSYCPKSEWKEQGR